MRKYIGSKSLFQVYYSPGDLYFWVGLMATKKLFFCFGSFKRMDQRLDCGRISGWKYRPLGALSGFIQHKSDIVATVLESSLTNVTFIRDVIGPRLEPWNALLGRLALVQLLQETNEFQWNMHENGKFPVGSMYRDFVQLDLSINK
jgi:hypothetical protein